MSVLHIRGLTEADIVLVKCDYPNARGQFWYADIMKMSVLQFITSVRVLCFLEQSLNPAAGVWMLPLNNYRKRLVWGGL